MDSKELSYRSIFYSLIAIAFIVIAMKFCDHQKEPMTLKPLTENASK